MEGQGGSAVEGKKRVKIIADDEKTNIGKLNTDADVLSGRPTGEKPARAYYIGPWGDQMSVFAAKMDRMLDENETRGGGDVSEVGDSSRATLTADKNEDDPG